MVLVSDSTRTENKLNNGNVRIYRRVLIVLFLLIATILIIQVVLGNRIGESRIWPGRYTAVLPEGTDIDALLTELFDSGVEGIISSGSVSVDYMDIPAMNSAALNEIDTILFPGDPRRDAWIVQAPQLFQSSDGREVIYLPADRSIRRYLKMMNTGTGDADIVIADEVSGGGVFSTGLFIIAAVLISLLGPKGWKHRIWIAAGTLVWIPYLWIAPTGAVPSAILIFFLLQFSTNRRGNQRYLFWLMAAAAALPLILGYPFPGSVASASMALGGSFLYFLFSPKGIRTAATGTTVQKTQKRPTASKSSGRRILSRRADHNLFNPLSLTDSFVEREPVKKALGSMAPMELVPILGSVLLLLLTGLIFTIQTFSPAQSQDSAPLEVPAPGSLVSEVLSASALHELDGWRDAYSLPDLSMLVASKAYQQGFMFGLEPGLPIPGDVVNIREYQNVEGSLETLERPVLIFDEQWFETTVNEIEQSPIGRLLLSPGGATSVVSIDIRQMPGMNSSQKVHATTFYIVLILSIILTVIFSHERHASRGAYISLSSVRRRAQAA